jgi:hypothetical protein
VNVSACFLDGRSADMASGLEVKLTQSDLIVSATAIRSNHLHVVADCGCHARAPFRPGSEARGIGLRIPCPGKTGSPFLMLQAPMPVLCPTIRKVCDRLEQQIPRLQGNSSERRAKGVKPCNPYAVE